MRVFYLRNKDNRTIVDTECYLKKEENNFEYVEISSVVDINYYSKFLLENLDRKDEIIADFEDLQELRCWLWETYVMVKQNPKDDYYDVIKILRKMFMCIADKYNLCYVED